jgi:hypothetical protein
VATALPAIAVCASPPFSEIDPAVPDVAVAVKVMTRLAIVFDSLTAFAPGTVTVAVSVFAPGLLPSLQLPTVATPAPSVVCDAPVIDPPPLATANVTAIFGTPLPLVSAILTEGGFATVEPTTAL